MAGSAAPQQEAHPIEEQAGSLHQPGSSKQLLSMGFSGSWKHAPFDPNQAQTTRMEIEAQIAATKGLGMDAPSTRRGSS
uniref:Uncharacterized protein n=1 Tax=Arundo donax TaxID=35708 RepID=A0A0A9ED51_ARUDO